MLCVIVFLYQLNMLIGFCLDGKGGGDGEVDKPLLCHIFFALGGDAVDLVFGEPVADSRLFRYTLRRCFFYKTIDISTISYYNQLCKYDFILSEV